MDKEVFSMRLKTARLIRGLSMDDLVEKLDRQVTKNAIARYERGEILPRMAVLEHMIKVLDLPIDYFFRPQSVEIDNVDFRTKSRLSVKEEESVRARVSELMERYLETERLLLMDEHFVNPIEGFVVHSAEEAEVAAMLWLQKLGLNEKGLINIYGLLEDQYVKVIELDAPDAFDGMALKVNKSISVVVINSNMTVERRRFTALHELAHLMLQFDAGMSNEGKEKCCHRFAGAALMPARLLQSLLGNQKETIYLSELIKIKEVYGISIQALMYRAEETGLISYRRLLRFKSWIADNNHYKEERLGSYKGKEETQRFETLVLRALAQEKVTVGKAAELLRLKVYEVKNLIKEAF